jgi:hypothetical protein
MTTIRATPLPIVGRPRESPWYGTRRLVARGANNAKDGPVLARVLNGLRGYSMRRDLPKTRGLTYKGLTKRSTRSLSHRCQRCAMGSPPTLAT